MNEKNPHDRRNHSRFGNTIMKNYYRSAAAILLLCGVQASAQSVLTLIAGDHTIRQAAGQTIQLKIRNDGSTLRPYLVSITMGVPVGNGIPRTGAIFVPPIDFESNTPWSAPNNRRHSTVIGVGTNPNFQTIGATWESSPASPWVLENGEHVAATLTIDGSRIRPGNYQLQWRGSQLVTTNPLDFKQPIHQNGTLTVVVPEPSVYALVAGGTALAFAFWRRRRRQGG